MFPCTNFRSPYDVLKFAKDMVKQVADRSAELDGEEVTQVVQVTNFL
jgi:hypothetical protein